MSAHVAIVNARCRAAGGNLLYRMARSNARRPP
jgi:hypothetical protein